jgi:hypothetical protein
MWYFGLWIQLCLLQMEMQVPQEIISAKSQCNTEYREHDNNASTKTEQEIVIPDTGPTP